MAVDSQEDIVTITKALAETRRAALLEAAQRVRDLALFQDESGAWEAGHSIACRDAAAVLDRLASDG